MSQNSDEKHSAQSRRLVMMGWEDLADRNAFLPKFRLSFSTGALKHSPDRFIPVLRDRQFLDAFSSIKAISSACSAFVQSRRFLTMRWEDMADVDQNPSRNCLPLSTGMKPSGGCFRAAVVKDRRNLLGREL